MPRKRQAVRNPFPRRGKNSTSGHSAQTVSNRPQRCQTQALRCDGRRFSALPPVLGSNLRVSSGCLTISGRTSVVPVRVSGLGSAFTNCVRPARFDSARGSGTSGPRDGRLARQRRGRCGGHPRPFRGAQCRTDDRRGGHGAVASGRGDHAAGHSGTDAAVEHPHRPRGRRRPLLVAGRRRRTARVAGQHDGGAVRSGSAFRPCCSPRPGPSPCPGGVGGRSGHGSASACGGGPSRFTDKAGPSAAVSTPARGGTAGSNRTGGGAPIRVLADQPGCAAAAAAAVPCGDRAKRRAPGSAAGRD